MMGPFSRLFPSSAPGSRTGCLVFVPAVLSGQGFPPRHQQQSDDRDRACENGRSVSHRRPLVAGHRGEEVRDALTACCPSGSAASDWTGGRLSVAEHLCETVSCNA